MDNFPLNKAHQLQRRAEALLRQKKFSECIETHKKAAELLNEAIIKTENQRSIESINLQKDYHLKQVETLKIKELQYQQYQQNKKCVKNKNKDTMENEENLENIIFRTMDNHDSLLNILLKSDIEDQKDILKENIVEMKEPSVTSVPSGRKHKVNEATIIEELKLSNKNLREAMKHYVDLVEEKNKEIERLRAEVYKLQCEKNQTPTNKTNGLKVITDSSGGTSPFVFSPCSELSPDVHDLKSFPVLAPLDMPQFDFTSFNKQLNLNNNS